MKTISPSILSANFTKLGEEINEITSAGINHIHIDVMDGHFVPNISMGLPILKSIRGITDAFLDVHLMISNPLEYVERFIYAGADGVTFHLEACEDEEEILTIIETIRKLEKKVGMSIKPKTKAEDIYKYLEHIDLALIMTVNPGFGGQKFMMDMLPKIEEISKYIKKHNLTTKIQVDGGINADTFPLVLNSGVDNIVIGSAIFKNNIKESVSKFLKIAGEHQ